MAPAAIQVHPATAERFDDVATVMTPKRGSGGGWCRLCRLTAKQYAAGKGDGHRAALRRLSARGAVPGVLAEAAGTPIGWRSVALLEGAAGFVGTQGDTIVEGYPVEPELAAYPAVYAWTGMAAAFRRGSLIEVARRSATRPIMRRGVPNG